jgi:predicted phosphoribosyltransferase
LYYLDFRKTSDEDVINLLSQFSARAGRQARPAS